MAVLAPSYPSPLPFLPPSHVAVPNPSPASHSTPRPSPFLTPRPRPTSLNQSQAEGAEAVGLDYLATIGVLYFRVPLEDRQAFVDRLAAERQYKNRDEVGPRPPRADCPLKVLTP